MAAAEITLRAAVPKKLAKRVKPIRIRSLAAGASVTRKIKVRVKRFAKRGRKLRVRVTVAASGVTSKSKVRTPRIR